MHYMHRERYYYCKRKKHQMQILSPLQTLTFVQVILLEHKQEEEDFRIFHG